MRTLNTLTLTAAILIWSLVGLVAREGRWGAASRQAGASAVELLVTLALIVAGLGTAWPLVAQPIDASRVRQAAAMLASQMRGARQRAVAAATSVAVVFDIVNGDWTFSLCADGNGNGVSRADIQSGKDRCVAGPYEIGPMFPGVSVAVNASLPDPDGGPGTSDPVQLGSANMASFSANGTSSSGTVYLQSAKGAQYAVRITGTTGRTRVLQYDTGAQVWVERS